MAEPFLSRDLMIAPNGIYIDPPQPQDRAIITHGHADHARYGHGAVLATPDTIAIMKARYGEDAAGRWDELPYGETRQLPGGVTEAGMPVAFQLVAGHFDEALLVRAGVAFQQATQWHQRHPAL